MIVNIDVQFAFIQVSVITVKFIHLQKNLRFVPCLVSQELLKVVKKKEGEIVEGIKRLSPLTGYLHLVNGVPFDYVHCVLQGVVKKFLKAWTKQKYFQQPF